MGLAAANFGFGATRRTVASRSIDSSRMYIQPMSNSYHLTDSFAELANVWWLLCSSSPPIRMPNGRMFVLASGQSKLR